MTFGIIVRNYEHMNHALGKYITSKRHYENEMAKGGFVPFEQGQKMAEAHKKRKEYKPSAKCVEVVKTLLNKKSKDGKITLTQHPRLMKAMKDGGMKFELPDWCPKHYREGGFDER